MTTATLTGFIDFSNDGTFGFQIQNDTTQTQETLVRIHPTGDVRLLNGSIVLGATSNAPRITVEPTFSAPTVVLKGSSGTATESTPRALMAGGMLIGPTGLIGTQQYASMQTSPTPSNDPQEDTYFRGYNAWIIDSNNLEDIFFPSGNVRMGRDVQIGGNVFIKGTRLYTSRWNPEEQTEGATITGIWTLCNVSIGKSNATEKLDVDGNIKTSGFFIGDGSLLTFGGAGALASQWSTNSNAGIFLMGSNVGIDIQNPEARLHVVGDTRIDGVLYAASNVSSGGHFVELSDARLKSDIRIISNPLEKIRNAHGYTYVRTDLDDGKRHAGFLAQEWDAIMPEVVFTDPQGFRAVSYGNSAALLLEAIKALDHKLEALRHDVENIKDHLFS